MKQQEIIIKTPARGFINITTDVNTVVKQSNVSVGMCHVFIKHTSASLIITENADPTVREDLENFMSKLIPDELQLYQHNYEGADDMPAHIRSVLTQTGVLIPIANQQLNLGTWQGLYLWEHRFQSHQRTLVVSCF